MTEKKTNPADVNGDGIVDYHDVNEMTGALLKGDKRPEYDVNKDGSDVLVAELQKIGDKQ